MEQINEILSVNPKAKALTEKWSKRIRIVEDVTNKEMPFERQYVLATCLENTQLALSMLNEVTQTPDIGAYKQFALDIVTAVVPNLVAQDIVSVQPIDNKVGVINYIKYLYGSNKGNIKQGDELASAFNLTSSDFNYSSSTVDGEVLGLAGATTYTGNLAYIPVIAGTVSITIGSITITDDGKGNLVGSGLTGTNTINYTDGAYTITLSTAASDAPVATYQYNLEYVPSTVPQIDVKIESLPVIAQSRKLRALYAFDAAFDLKRNYGGDIDALLTSQIAGEIAHEIDAEIMNDLLMQAGAGPEFSFSTTVPEGISLAEHYEALYPKLTAASNTIFQATKRATGNFLIVGTNVASIIEVLRGFQPETPASTIGPHKIGTLGSFSVYKNPYYDPDYMVVGYRGANYFESGYFYCPYMPIITTDLVMLDDFTGRRGWATSYAKKMVNNKFYIRGKLTA